jgi:hypothetical protein
MVSNVDLKKVLVGVRRSCTFGLTARTNRTAMDDLDGTRVRSGITLHFTPEVV